MFFFACMDQRIYCFCSSCVIWIAHDVSVYVSACAALMKHKLLRDEITHSFASLKLSLRVFFDCDDCTNVSFYWLGHKSRTKNVQKKKIKKFDVSLQQKIPGQTYATTKDSCRVSSNINEIVFFGCALDLLSGSKKKIISKFCAKTFRSWNIYGRVEAIRNFDFYPVHDLI